MWRFKASKYKNAAPKVPKKNEGWITDITIDTPISCSNHIKASAAFMAFNLDTGGGGSLGVLPLDDFGSKRTNLPRLNAHADVITDFEFCPYDDGLLATGSQDHHVKLWRISDRPTFTSIPSNPLEDLLLDDRVENIAFHPVTDCLLTTADGNTVRLWDVSAKSQIHVNSHDDIVQNLSWKADGRQLASCGRDKKLRIWDPRDTTQSLVTSSHANNRDVRVVWLGDGTRILTSGFGSGREREVIIRDIRSITEPLSTYYGESSMGVLIPLFDSDTNMLFMVGKADTVISFCEITDKDPYFQEASKYMGNTQVKGAALVPKRGLKVMDGEVNRVLILGSDCIVPIPYIVPRKTYREFHADLFPSTRLPEPAMTVNQWESGENAKATTMSLDPSSTLSKLRLKFSHELGYGPAKLQSLNQTNNNFPTQNMFESSQPPKVETENMPVIETSIENPIPKTSPKPLLAPKPKVSSPQTVHKIVVSKTDFGNNSSPVSTLINSTQPKTSEPKQSPSPRRPARTFGIRSSKFRHLNGTILPAETHITDISSLTRTVPGESNGFEANRKYIALPMGANGGLIAILPLSLRGRAPSLADVSGVLCGTKCNDFAWDPFDDHRLITACDTGDIQIWNIHAENLGQKISEPISTLRGPTDKASILKFNPCAQDIICSTGSDLRVHIWDLQLGKVQISLEGHNDQVLSLAWSFDGNYVATVSKDQKVRLYEPRNSSKPIREGVGPEGIRGARIVWVLHGSHFVVSGFNKVSERQVYLYDFKDISEPLGNFGLDVCPATLIPFYDDDSSTLFLTGKGDSTVYAFEVATDNPYFHPLSHYKCSGPHQALSFLPKIVCNVRDVEFARAIRLTTSLIETLSFYVPRLKAEFFQDDIFPDTRVSWEPTMSCSEWFAYSNKLQKYISLKPSEMVPLSEAPTQVKTVPEVKQSPASTQIAFEGELVLEGSLAFLQNSKEKEERIVQSMKSKCLFQQNSLPQDAFEGVDPEEWDEEEQRHAQQNH